MSKDSFVTITTQATIGVLVYGLMVAFAFIHPAAAEDVQGTPSWDYDGCNGGGCDPNNTGPGFGDPTGPTNDFGDPPT